MRLHPLFILFAISAVAALPATSTALAQPAPASPQIQFEKQVHDYGIIAQGSSGVAEFRFKNIGKQPLIISEARSSCGCVSARYPKSPILTGAQGVVTVTYDTQRLGGFMKTLSIASNGSENIVVLTVKGTVDRPLP